MSDNHVCNEDCTDPECTLKQRNQYRDRLVALLDGLKVPDPSATSQSSTVFLRQLGAEIAYVAETGKTNPLVLVTLAAAAFGGDE